MATSLTTRDLVAATLSGPFLAGGVRYDAIEQLHRGEVDPWLSELHDVLSAPELAETAVLWRARPRILLDILLDRADDVTRRRCVITWAALDRLAPLAQIG